MTDTIVAMQLLSIVYMFVFLYGALVEGHGRTLSSKLASVLVAACILGLALDALTWNIGNVKNVTAILYVITVFNMNMGKILFTIFAYYVVAKINERGKISYWTAHTALIVNVIGAAVTIYFAVTGQLFTLKPGLYMAGPMYAYTEVSTVIVMVYLVFVICIYHKSLGLNTTVASLIYVAVPFVVFVIKIFDDSFQYVSLSVAVTTSILYVVTQSKEIHRSYHKEQDLSYKSNTDNMTGLHNRRAYDSALRSLGNNGQIGVIFCDLNGLKYMNDNFSHQDGDQLIIRFADILKSIFYLDDIFRTGGDEFIVLFRDNSKELFDKNLVRLKRKIAGYDPIASVGAAFGDEMDVENLVKKAEEEMYEDKKKYYETTGRNRRR